MVFAVQLDLYRGHALTSTLAKPIVISSTWMGGWVSAGWFRGLIWEPKSDVSKPLLKVNIYLGCMKYDTNTMLRRYTAYPIRIQTSPILANPCPRPTWFHMGGYFVVVVIVVIFNQLNKGLTNNWELTCPLARARERTDCCVVIVVFFVVIVFIIQVTKSPTTDWESTCDICRGEGMYKLP